MLANRSTPSAIIIPVLAYDDIDAAVAWLCDAFGFSERLRIGDHRAQLTLGAGALVVVQRDAAATGAASTADRSPHEHATHDHSMLVRVVDVDAHAARATRLGAAIIHPPTDHPYGERQYTALDLGGHRWTFSQSIADVHPETWGGILCERDDA